MKIGILSAIPLGNCRIQPWTLRGNTEKLNLFFSVPLCLRGFLSLAFIFALSGCSWHTHISEINDTPQQYKDKQVSIKGKVVETLSIPFIQKGLYQMDDGSGKIWIVSQKRVPFRGEKVTVKGEVKTSFTIGTRTFGTVIVEKEE